MRKQFVWLCAVLVAVLCLSGCRFAMEETTSGGKDRLIGVSLRVYDPGQPDGVGEDGEVFWNSDENERAQNGEAQVRLQGDEFIVEYPEKSTAQEMGSYYSYMRRSTGENGDIHNEIEQNWPGIVQNHITVSGNSEVYEMDASVYLCGDLFAQGTTPSYATLFFDSVYQREDGSVYVVSDRAGMSGMLDGFSQETETTSTVTTPDGQSQEWGFRFRVELIRVPKLLSARVLAFDESNAVIEEIPLMHAEEGGSGGYFCRIVIPPEAAYLILEETSVDSQGQTCVTRTAANLPAQENEPLFPLRVPAGDGFALPCPVYSASYGA